MPPTYANSTEPLPIWERAGPAPIRGLAREAIFGIVFMIVVFAFIILAFFWVANGMQRPRPLSVLAAEAKAIWATAVVLWHALRLASILDALAAASEDPAPLPRHASGAPAVGPRRALRARTPFVVVVPAPRARAPEVSSSGSTLSGGTKASDTEMDHIARPAPVGRQPTGPPGAEEASGTDAGADVSAPVAPVTPVSAPSVGVTPSAGAAGTGNGTDDQESEVPVAVQDPGSRA